MPETPQVPDAAKILREEGQKKIDVKRIDIKVGLTDEAYKHIATRDYVPPSAPGLYSPRDDTPPQVPNQQYQEMANYGKLTAVERSLPKALMSVQRFKEKIPDWAFENPISKAVGKAGGWALDKLKFLDIGAEGLERTVGLAAQWADAKEEGELDEFWGDLRGAWAAGSLAYDVTDMVHITDEDGLSVNMPMDLPGVRELDTFKDRINQRVAQGQDYKAAMEAVKSEYMDSLGALQIRATVSDALGHIVIDPLWLVSKLNVLEKIDSISEVSRSGKYVPALLDSYKDAARVARAEGLVDKAADIEKVIDTILETRKPINSLDRLAMFITGKMPAMPDDAGPVAKFINDTRSLAPAETKFGKFIQKVNPFSLTPESRAIQYRDRITDYLVTHLAHKSPEEQVSLIRKLAEGAVSGEAAMMGITQDGRMVQAALQKIDVDAVQLLVGHIALRGKGDDLLRAGEILGIKAEQLIDDIADGKAPAILDDLIKHSDEGAEIAQRVGLKGIEDWKNLRGTPYTENLFGHILRNKILDSATQVSILRYGVKPKGLLHKTAQALKSAETLAFLRLNPTFAVKNFINNEFTMMAEGVWNLRRGKAMTEVMQEGLGFLPHRFGEAYTMADIGADVENASDAYKTLVEATQSAKTWGKWMENISNKINDVDLGFLDMGSLSSKAEKWASQRAFTKGYLRGIDRYVRSGKAFTPMEKVLSPAVVAEIGADKMQALSMAYRNAMNVDDLGKLEGVDLARNATGVMVDAQKALGSDVVDILGPDVSNALVRNLQFIYDDFDDAAVARRKITKLFDNTWRGMADEISEGARVASDSLEWYFDAVAQQQGPQAFTSLMTHIADDMIQTEIAYGLAMERFNPGAMSPAVREIVWPEWFDAMSGHHERGWERAHTMIDGLKAGADEVGMKIPSAALDQFDELEKAQRTFFDTRNGLYDDFFGALAKGEIPDKSWHEVTDEVSKLYDEFMVAEQSLFKNQHDILLEYIDELKPELADDLAAGLERSRELRGKLRGTVKRYMDDIRDKKLSKPEGYKDMFRAKQPILADIVDNERKLSIAMMGEKQDFGRVRGFESMIERGVQFKGSELLTHSQRIADKIKEGAELTIHEQQFLANYTDEIEKLLKEGDVLRATEGVGEAPVLRATKKVLQEEMDTVPTRTFPLIEEELQKGGAPFFYNKMQDDFFVSRKLDALQELEKQAMGRLDKPSMFLDDLSDAAKSELGTYSAMAKTQMADAQYAALKHGEWMRDAALLNYKRRYNFDTWLSVVMPYEFWMTHSAAKWAMRMIDKPSMGAVYYRLRQLQDRIALDDESFPTRLKGTLRVPVPWVSEELGGAYYVDPFKTVLPFGTFVMPYERVYQDASSFQSMVTRSLERMVREGEISQAEMDMALRTQSGDAFQSARLDAKSSMGNRTDGFDVMSMMSAPHAPIQWAYKTLTGQKEDIGPFLPATYTMARFLGAAGIDYPHSKLAKMTPGAVLRKAWGLPAFDQWEDYRVDRMVTNMVKTNELDITSPDVRLAMTQRTGPVWEEAKKKAAKEFSGGGFMGAILKSAGVRLGLYPEGERELRQLQDDYNRAWDMYNAGDKRAIEKFYQAHTEYEARSYLWDEPEERLHGFLVSDIWETYLDMPTVQRREVREALGDEFVQRFLDKNTRNPDDVPLPTLQSWLRMMGSETPGALGSNAIPIDKAPDTVAYRAEAFYETRRNQFPNFWELQDEYFDLDKGARREYLKLHPELKQYWDWRRDFLKRNPRTAPYIDDDFEPKYSTVEEMQQYRAQPQLTLFEYSNLMSEPLVRIVIDAYQGGSIDQDIREHIAEYAERLGMTYEQLLTDVGSQALQE